MLYKFTFPERAAIITRYKGRAFLLHQFANAKPQSKSDKLSRRETPRKQKQGMKGMERDEIMFVFIPLIYIRGLVFSATNITKLNNIFTDSNVMTFARY